MKFIKVTIVAGLVIAAASADLVKEHISSNKMFILDDEAIMNYMMADFVMIGAIAALLAIVAFSPAMRAVIKNNILKGGVLVAMILPWFTSLVTHRVLAACEVSKSKASLVASALSTAVSIGLGMFYAPFWRNVTIVMELLMFSFSVKSYMRDRRFDKIFN